MPLVLGVLGRFCGNFGELRGICGVKMGEKPIFGRFRGVFRGELGVAAGGAGRMERAV